MLWWRQSGITTIGPTQIKHGLLLSQQRIVTRKLWILPWDTDASWGPNWNRGHDLVYNSLFPAFGDGGDNTTPNSGRNISTRFGNYETCYGSAIKFFRSLMNLPTLLLPSNAASRWKDAPSDAGNYFGLGGAGAKSISSLARDMKSFAFVGEIGQVQVSVRVGGRLILTSFKLQMEKVQSIPSTPTITYSGLLNFPANGLVFESSGFSDPQGENTFGAMEWRVAKITNPNAPGHNPEERFKLEWQAEWESGELNTFDPSLALSSSVVYPGILPSSATPQGQYRSLESLVIPDRIYSDSSRYFSLFRWPDHIRSDVSSK